MPKFTKGEKVDLITKQGRQRGIVVRPNTGRRGPGAMVDVKLTTAGEYPRGVVSAYAQDVTARSRG